MVGSGAFGGWTALHLAGLGAQVELIDSWGPGNPRSSSGGETRVIRAIYGADRVYVEMVKRAYELMGMRVHLQVSHILTNMVGAASDVQERRRKLIESGLKPRDFIDKSGPEEP